MIINQFRNPYTPDGMDVEGKLSEAVADLHPRYESPVRDLFAVDGLGNQPNEQRPLRDKSAS
jgi:hypothetical protein